MSVGEGTRKVGRIGERTFDLWATQANLSCNPSHSCDENGWDFLVEFPHSIGKATADLSKAPFECKVQVKATDTQTNSWSIKLSNLIRLCTTPSPIFFMIVKFDGQDNPVEALVRHVDNDLITDVLAKAHQLRQENPSIEFHKHEHTITFHKDGALSELSGHGVKKKLLSYIGDDFNEYCRRKDKHLKVTGYEDGYAKINFSTIGKAQLTNLVDSFLGKHTLITATNITITDQRFGIPDKYTEEKIEEGVFAISNVRHEKAKIKYRPNNYSPPISFDVNLYGNPWYDLLPDDLKKMRIEHDYFELEINPELALSHYTFSFNKIKRIELKRFLELLTFYDTLTNHENEPALEVIRSNGDSATLPLTPIEKDIDFSQQIQALKLELRILDHFEIHETITTTYNEITRQSKKIIEFSDLIKGIKIRSLSIGLDNIQYDESKECMYLTPFFLEIEKYLLIQIVSIKGKSFLNADRIEILEPIANLERKTILEYGNFTNQENIKSEIMNQMFTIADKYNDQYFTICEDILNG